MRVNITAARVLVIVLFFVFVAGAGHAYYKMLGRIHEQPVTAFLGFAIAIAIFYFLITKITDKAVRDYWHNLVGLRSERTVLLELEQLPDEYRVFRNVQFDDGYDIDFVVVGPRGVFVFEVNSTRGDVSVEGEQLLVDGKLMNGKDRSKQALRNTMEVSNYLDGKYYVQGAAVFAHYRTKLNIGFRKVGGVFVIKHQWLTKLILEQSDDQHLTPEQQQFAIDKLRLTMQTS